MHASGYHILDKSGLFIQYQNLSELTCRKFLIPISRRLRIVFLDNLNDTGRIMGEYPIIPRGKDLNK